MVGSGIWYNIKMQEDDYLNTLNLQDHLANGYNPEDEDAHYALEESEDTYTLVFRFNSRKLQEDGLTEDELLQPMRAFAKEKGDIQEIKPGIFQSTGKDAYALIYMSVPKLTYQNIKILVYLEKWKIYNRHKISDARTDSISWFMKREPQRMVELGLDKVVMEKEAVSEIMEELPIGYDPEDEDAHYALEESEDTYTLVFRFNSRKLQEDGLTEDELLQPMRAFAKEKGDIQEIKPGIFQSTGKDAYALIYMSVPKLTYQNIKILVYLEKWKIYNSYEISDVLIDSIEWFKKDSPEIIKELNLGGIC